jgi:hypothetical protein
MIEELGQGNNLDELLIQGKLRERRSRKPLLYQDQVLE